MKRGSRVPGGELTEREIQALRLTAQGHTREAIARKMGLPPSGAVYLLQNAKLKLGTRTVARSVAVGVATGIIKCRPVEGEPEPLLTGELRAILVCISEDRTKKEMMHLLAIEKSKLARRIAQLYKTIGASPGSRPHLIYKGIETGNLVINRRKET